MSTHRLVIKDAAWQLLWRAMSAALGFVVTKMMSWYLGPLRYGDFSTILKYFAIWSALADFGLYVIAIKKMGVIKWLEEAGKEAKGTLQREYGKFAGTRFVTMTIVYTTALVIAYFLPAYTDNPYLIRWLPIGMLFSASFMWAGIIQLPVQIFWKMKELSFWLFWSRISQIVTLIPVIYRWYKGTLFDTASHHAVIAFLLVISSVLVSGIVQRWYVQHHSDKLLPLRVIIDRQFIKKMYVQNRQYWLWYYFSSFHTLIVLILLSNFFPTSQGYTYTGIWWLTLWLIEILIIIPSSLGNSLLHTIAWYSLAHKRQSFWNLMTMMYWVGGIVLLNFWLFAEPIVRLVWGDAFLGTSFSHPGGNQILPFLAFVLLLSFIKQVFNYLFVAIEKNNEILWVNSIGVAIGLTVGIFIIPKYAMMGWVVTQVLLEVLYVLWWVVIALRYKAMPFVSRSKIGLLTALLAAFGGVSYFFVYGQHLSLWMAIVYGCVINIPLVWLSFPTLKKIARWLTPQQI